MESSTSTSNIFQMNGLTSHPVVTVVPFSSTRVCSQSILLHKSYIPTKMRNCQRGSFCRREMGSHGSHVTFPQTWEQLNVEEYGSNDPCPDLHLLSSAPCRRRLPWLTFPYGRHIHTLGCILKSSLSNLLLNFWLCYFCVSAFLGWAFATRVAYLPFAFHPLGCIWEEQRPLNTCVAFHDAFRMATIMGG